MSGHAQPHANIGQLCAVTLYTNTMIDYSSWCSGLDEFIHMIISLSQFTIIFLSVHYVLFLTKVIITVHCTAFVNIACSGWTVFKMQLSSVNGQIFNRVLNGLRFLSP